MSSEWDEAAMARGRDEAAMARGRDEAATARARDYYDSEDADRFYREIWGGEDIHVGLYAPGDSIPQASRRTVERMAEMLGGLGEGAHVLDLGAGYGGAARYLAACFGAHVTCLNLSTVENARNRELTSAAGLDDRIEVVDGAFEALPFEDVCFDVIWSQDAILHSGDRPAVLKEAARVLKPGGEMIFTDPMQADDISDMAVLQPIYDRLHLGDLATIRFYRETLAALGLEEVSVDKRTDQLTAHYASVAEMLTARRDALEPRISPAYIDRTLSGLSHWVEAGRKDQLAWGILHFRKK